MKASLFICYRGSIVANASNKEVVISTCLVANPTFVQELEYIKIFRKDDVARFNFRTRWNLELSLMALMLNDLDVAGGTAVSHTLLATTKFVPSVFTWAVIGLIALDFYGFGRSPVLPSLGDMLWQSKSNLTARWLGLSGIVTIAAILLPLYFIGRAVRNACAQRNVSAYGG
jgi:ABC-type microcin C transport system permease subunit YejE